MFDKETEKALECCSTKDNCSDCPYNISKPCLPRLCKDALSYINRLKEENERFAKENEKGTLAKVAEQTAKDTAEKILRDLKGLLEGYVDKRTGETLYKQLAKKYDMEVEDE